MGFLLTNVIFHSFALWHIFKIFPELLQVFDNFLLRFGDIFNVFNVFFIFLM